MMTVSSVSRKTTRKTGTAKTFSTVDMIDYKTKVLLTQPLKQKKIRVSA